MRHTLTVLGVFLAGGIGFAAAQDDPPAAERPVRGQANTNAERERADGPSDAAMIRAKTAAHALCMAIEGNGLATAARMAGAPGGAPGARPGPGADPAATPRIEPATEARPGEPAAGEAATTAARGAAEGVTQEGEAATPAGRAATRRAPGRELGAANAAGNPGAMLQRHSAMAFEASRTLFAASESRTEAGGARGEAATQDQAIDEFCRAAREYGRALESMSQGGGAGRDADGNLAAGRTLNPEDSGQVCLINHAVSETVNGLFLKKLMQMHAQNDGASRALLAHAQQMYSEGQRGIRMISGGGANEAPGAVPGRGRDQADPAAPGADPAPAPAPGIRTLTQPGPGGASGRGGAPGRGRPAGVAQGGENDVVTLARLGREVVAAAVALDQGDRPAGDRPAGDRPADDRPVGDRPVGDRPAGDRPAGDRPAAERPAADRPVGDRPATERPR